VTATVHALPRFRCTKCGHPHPAYAGRCEQCRAWNAVRPVRDVNGEDEGARVAKHAVPITELSGESIPRLSTGFQVLDRVLGPHPEAKSCGLARGKVYICASDAGVGKSTLWVKAAAHVAKTRPDDGALYIAIEEGHDAVVARAKRVGALAQALRLTTVETTDDVGAMLYDLRPGLAVIDSLNTISHEGREPGTAMCLIGATRALVACAKASGSTLVLICHETKDGSAAGPNQVRHLVDAEILGARSDLLDNGDPVVTFKTGKNRYGPAQLVAWFANGELGLREVKAP